MSSTVAAPPLPSSSAVQASDVLPCPAVSASPRSGLVPASGGQHPIIGQQPETEPRVPKPDPDAADIAPPDVAVKVEDDQAAEASPHAEGRKVSTKDIQLVQNLIERCLQLYMSQREVVSTLHTQAEVEPGFTGLVWQKLEEQNSSFFQAYYTRLKLKDQILLFNHLLDQQVAVVQRMQWNRPVQPTAQVPDMAGMATASTRALDTSASTAPLETAGNVYGQFPDLDRHNQASGLGGAMTSAPASPPLFVSEAAHSSGHPGSGTLGASHMSTDNLMGLGQMNATSPVSYPGNSGDQAIPHVFSMSDIDRHLEFGNADELTELDLDTL